MSSTETDEEFGDSRPIGVLMDRETRLWEFTSARLVNSGVILGCHDGCTRFIPNHRFTDLWLPRSESSSYAGHFVVTDPTGIVSFEREGNEWAYEDVPGFSLGGGYLGDDASEEA